METPTVVVTGFGPFRNHTTNSSWLTVLELVKLDIKDINFVAKELPVEYEAVSKAVPELWEKYKPTLVVHCGMSEQAKHLTIEQLANNKHYKGQDVQGKLPAANVCCQDGPDVICSNINVKQIAEEVSKSSVPVEVSDNAGRYLCEFIYYSSLRINRNTIFVHVPQITDSLQVEELAKNLAVIIRAVLKQCQPCS